MTDLTPADASAALHDIERAEQRTYRAIFRGITSDFLLLWGVAIGAAYTITQFAPRYAWIAWPALQLVGWALTVVLVLLRRPRLSAGGRRRTWQWLLSALAMVVFGHLLLTMLDPVDYRQEGLIWSLIFAFGFTLAGVWTEPALVACGLAVGALGVMIPVWTTSFYFLSMAAAWGGVQIACGLWLRLTGARS